MEIAQAPHPLADLAFLVGDLPGPLVELPTPTSILGLLGPGAQAPLAADDAVRGAVRDLLRHGGYKPTGRGKPASEYLLRASTEGTLRAINLVADIGNAVSLHSGLPISVVDLDRTRGALRVDVAPAGATYVFNPAGQEIDVEGLLCLFDEEGPCANAVKDAHRTKTDGTTRRTLTVIWGTRALPGRTEAARAWMAKFLCETGIRLA